MQNLSPQPYFGLSSNTTGVTSGYIKQFTSTKTSEQPNKYQLRYTCCLKLNFNYQSSSPSARSSTVQFRLQPSRHDRQGVPSMSLDESTPHRACTSLSLSTDLHMPIQLQSKDATQTLPAYPFHSQSAEVLMHN
jgi:hypothetical protein